MSQRIEQLSTDVSNKIAAGEVVERPASVVKELVENAIDAGAGRIEITCRQGGKELIQIKDDGHGIRSADAPLAWQRHATSKITGAEDLFCIKTLGFRGEALPSIAAVSDIQMLTRHVDEEIGTFLELKAGELTAHRDQAYPVGTTIMVNNLFYNTPARYKFLKTTATERRYIIDLVSNLALSNGEIAFKLVMDDEQVLLAQGTGKLEDAVLAVYGAEVAENMLSVEHSLGPYRLTGLVGRPEIARGNRNYETVFVNHRWVKDRLILAAVEKAYREFLPTKRFPVVVLNLSVPADLVDVNVHPAKAEVRFKDESMIFRLVITALEGVFKRNQLIQPFEIERTPIYHQARPVQQTQAAMDYGTATRYTPRQERMADTPSWEGIPRIQDESVVEDIHIIGQLWDTYILMADEESFWLIDQHAAAERINFDKLKTQWAASVDSGLARQALVVPIPLELPLAQGELINEHRGKLERLGFKVEPFGQSSFLLQEIPVALEMLRTSPGEIEATVEEILRQIEEEDDWENQALSSIACKAAIKANHRLQPTEMQGLVQNFKKTANPYTCPHGRPAILELSRKEVEKSFARR
ncbi:MAG: DNA mismatch repair endonuclease MutL [Limnochordia bacterium]|nr:DNA mismatch repair endonuclease MutL [Limnochordia bacterium]